MDNKGSMSGGLAVSDEGASGKKIVKKYPFGKVILERSYYEVITPSFQKLLKMACRYIEDDGRYFYCIYNYVFLSSLTMILLSNHILQRLS